MHRPEAVEQRGSTEDPGAAQEEMAGAHLKSLDIAYPMMALLEATLVVMCRPPHCHLVGHGVRPSRGFGSSAGLKQGKCCCWAPGWHFSTGCIWSQEVSPWCQVAYLQKWFWGGSLVHVKRLQSFLGHCDPKRYGSHPKRPLCWLSPPGHPWLCSIISPLPGMRALPQAPGVQPLSLS